MSEKKKDKPKLIWNVFTKDNRDEVIVFNVFDHYSFMNDLVQIKKKYKEDFEKFSEEVRKSLAYYYWSKYEWEIVITNFVPRITAEELDRLNKEKEKDMANYGRFVSTWVELKHSMKVDVYAQVTMNWDLFINYLWTNIKLIKKPL